MLVSEVRPIGGRATAPNNVLWPMQTTRPLINVQLRLPHPSQQPLGFRLMPFHDNNIEHVLVTSARCVAPVSTSFTPPKKPFVLCLAGRCVRFGVKMSNHPHEKSFVRCCPWPSSLSIHCLRRSVSVIEEFVSQFAIFIRIAFTTTDRQWLFCSTSTRNVACPRGDRQIWDEEYGMGIGSCSYVF